MSKTFIIAEMSANHNQNKQTALDTIRAAKKAGADAIKIQTYTSETMTLDCNKSDFILGKGLWEGDSYFLLYLRNGGCDDITLLKCTSAYPAPIEDANLLTIPDMKNRFGVKVGLSDHTEGSTVPMAAVALGAEVVEKHFIIDRSIGGPDSAFSMNVEDFTEMVKKVRQVEEALGKVYYPTDPTKIKGREHSRSLYVAEDVKAGDVVTEKNVRSVRPGYGLHPKYLKDVLGKKFAKDCEKGDRFALDLVK